MRAAGRGRGEGGSLGVLFLGFWDCSEPVRGGSISGRKILWLGSPS